MVTTMPMRISHEGSAGGGRMVNREWRRVPSAKCKMNPRGERRNAVRGKDER